MVKYETIDRSIERIDEEAEELASQPLNDLLCVNNRYECRFFKFYDSVTCLFAEGVEFMAKDQIYDAIKSDWKKFST